MEKNNILKIILIFLFVILIKCCLQKKEYFSEKKEINIYSSLSKNYYYEVFDNFTKNTGIKINVIYARSEILFERLKREGNNSPADLFLASDTKYLQHINFQQLNSNKKDKKYFEKISKVQKVIFYNPNVISKDEIKGLNLKGLSDDKWKGRIIISLKDYNKYKMISDAPPDPDYHHDQEIIDEEHSEELSLHDDHDDHHDYEEIIDEEHSEEHSEELSLHDDYHDHLILKEQLMEEEMWEKKLLDNLAEQPYNSNDAQRIISILSGKADITIGDSNTIGLWLSGKKFSKHDKEYAKKIKMHKLEDFQESTVRNVIFRGIGLLKHAPNKENAKLFIDYLLSKNGQKYISSSTYDYPLD